MSRLALLVLLLAVSVDGTRFEDGRPCDPHLCRSTAGGASLLQLKHRKRSIHGDHAHHGEAKQPVGEAVESKPSDVTVVDGIKLAEEAYQCCGTRRAYAFVLSVPGSERRLFDQLKASSPDEREVLLAPFPKWPGRYCTEDYDCTFATELEGQLIDCGIEHDTIDHYNKWIPHGSKVLEVGARYGQATCYLSRLVGPDGHVMAVDADASIWDTWDQNIQAHGCNAELVRGVVGRAHKTLVDDFWGYGTTTVDTNTSTDAEVPAHTWQSLGVQFDTLAIDCEGCFATFLAENPGLEAMLNLIVAEVHDEGEETEVQRLIESGWQSLDPAGNRYRMHVLSRSSIEPSNHTCISDLSAQQ